MIAMGGTCLDPAAILVRRVNFIWALQPVLMSHRTRIQTARVRQQHPSAAVLSPLIKAGVAAALTMAKHLRETALMMVEPLCICTTNRKFRRISEIEFAARNWPGCS